MKIATGSSDRDGRAPDASGAAAAAARWLHGAASTAVRALLLFGGTAAALAAPASASGAVAAADPSGSASAAAAVQAVEPVAQAVAATASASAAFLWAAPDARFIYGVVVVVMVASVVALLMVRSALTASPWSFADAMSEPTETTAAERDAAGNAVISTQMRASSSRMLALMGAVVILLMFLGFGTVALFSFATTGDLPPAMDRVVHFLLAGMTLFAPYAVNRFAKLFENLSQRPR